MKSFHGEIAYDERDRELFETWGGRDPNAVPSETDYAYAGDRMTSVTYRQGAPLVTLQMPLTAVSLSTEGRYKLRPDFYLAARYDRLGFSDETATVGTLPWDAVVNRVEVGGGYSIQRNLLLKASFQYDHREGGRLQSLAYLPAVQLVFWF